MPGSQEKQLTLLKQHRRNQFMPSGRSFNDAIIGNTGKAFSLFLLPAVRLNATEGEGKSKERGGRREMHLFL